MRPSTWAVAVVLLGGPAPADEPLPPGAVLRLGEDRLRVGGRFLPGVAFTPDSRQIVTAGSGGGLDVWDATTGRHLRRLAGPPDIFRLTVSPDGRRAATALRNELALWDLRTGECVHL